jgi:hypothetical protein
LSGQEEFKEYPVKKKKKKKEGRKKESKINVQQL